MTNCGFAVDHHVPHKSALSRRFVNLPNHLLKNGVSSLTHSTLTSCIFRIHIRGLFWTGPLTPRFCMGLDLSRLPGFWSFARDAVAASCKADMAQNRVAALLSAQPGAPEVHTASGHGTRGSRLVPCEPVLLVMRTRAFPGCGATGKRGWRLLLSSGLLHASGQGAPKTLQRWDPAVAPRSRPAK